MPLAVGTRAPAFRLRGTDNSYWILGEPDKRRSVILAFFRRESSASRLLFPFIERLYRRARTHPAEILGISLDNLPDTIEFAEDYMITFPLLIDSDHLATVREYKVDQVPTVYRLNGRLEVEQILVSWSKSGFEDLAGAHLKDVGGRALTIWESRDIPPDTARAMTLTDPRLR